MRVAFDQGPATGNGKPRFRAAIDDFEGKTRLRLHASQKLGAIRSGTAGLRGDQARAAHRAQTKLLRADLECLDGAIHRRPTQAAARRQPLSEADDARKGVDDAELSG